MKPTRKLMSSFCGVMLVGGLLWASPVVAAPPAPADGNPAREVSDEQLLDELLRGAPGEAPAVITARRIAALMDRSASRLAVDQDPGTRTQKVQDEIVAGLDELIRLAKRQPPPPPATKPSTQPGPPPENIGIKPENEDRTGGPSDMPKPNKGNVPANESKLTSGSGGGSDGRTLLDERNPLFKLPPRVRPAVMSGMNEQWIEKYRRLIEDYYSAIGRAASRS